MGKLSIETTLTLWDDNLGERIITLAPDDDGLKLIKIIFHEYCVGLERSVIATIDYKQARKLIEMLETKLKETDPA